MKSLSRVRLLATRLLANPWTVAYQAPPSMGFSRQEYWSGVPLPSPDNSSGRAKNANAVCVFGQFFRMSGTISHLDRKKKKSEVDRIILKEYIL